MPSQASTLQQTPFSCGKRTLQRLRREAGYHSARDFAEVVNIPASTYSRYEQRPDGPEKAIPLGAAWAIADELGCTIDLVVGREDIDARPVNPLQEAYDSLSLTAKSLFDDYLAYLQYRDTPGSRR